MSKIGVPERIIKVEPVFSPVPEKPVRIPEKEPELEPAKT